MSSLLMKKPNDNKTSFQRHGAIDNDFIPKRDISYTIVFNQPLD